MSEIERLSKEYPWLLELDLKSNDSEDCHHPQWVNVSMAALLQEAVRLKFENDLLSSGEAYRLVVKEGRRLNMEIERLRQERDQWRMSATLEDK